MISLIKVRPGLPVLYKTHQRMTDAIVSSNYTLRSCVGSDCQDLIRGQFGGDVILTCVSSFGAPVAINHILNVLSLRAWNQMVDIHACSIVAFVSKNNAGCSSYYIDATMSLLPGFNMSTYKSITCPKSSIPRPKGASPWPALIRFTNFHIGPELGAPFLQGLGTTDKLTLIRTVFSLLSATRLNMEYKSACRALNLRCRLAAGKILTVATTVILLVNPFWQFLKLKTAAITGDGHSFGSLSRHWYFLSVEEGKQSQNGSATSMKSCCRTRVKMSSHPATSLLAR